MPNHTAEGSVAIVVPTLNEAENVAPLVQQIVVAVPRCAEIIIVDDGSTDGTRERVQKLTSSAPVRLLARDQPTLGLSGAVIAGARSAMSDVLVVMDADLSHPPSEISRLAEPVLNGRADIVIGSRYVRGGTTPGWPMYRKLMSRVAAGLAYPLTGVHDSMCGFFAIRRSRLLELAPHATGFKIAFEAIVHGGRELRVLELPIAFRDRARGTSKMNLAVALVFSARWFAAAGRLVTRKRAGVSDPTAPVRVR
jgi:dolichol-phosphate mannosyltransferase